MMCSVYDMQDRRHFARNCSSAYKSDPKRTRSWASEDLKSQYDDACPYYDRLDVPLPLDRFCLGIYSYILFYHISLLFSCAKTLDAGKCRAGDLKFTFIGRVGVITKLDNTQVCAVFIFLSFRIIVACRNGHQCPCGLS